MISRPVIPRAIAEQDVDQALEHYLTEAGEKIALGFIDALQNAYSHISYQPASGSPRYAHMLDLPGLRFWQVKRYPYLVFYIEKSDHIDVWRILHDQRDIPEWMQEPDAR